MLVRAGCGASGCRRLLDDGEDQIARAARERVARAPVDVIAVAARVECAGVEIVDQPETTPGRVRAGLREPEERALTTREESGQSTRVHGVARRWAAGARTKPCADLERRAARDAGEVRGHLLLAR